MESDYLIIKNALTGKTLSVSTEAQSFGDAILSSLGFQVAEADLVAA